jgi:hypothetical protein
MQTIQDILKKFNPVHDRYISREFQTYAMHLTEILGDEKHKSLYMRLSKSVPRAILEKALSFVVDANTDNKAKLFMWKLKEMKAMKYLEGKRPVKKTGANPGKQKKKIEPSEDATLPLFS